MRFPAVPQFRFQGTVEIVNPQRYRVQTGQLKEFVVPIRSLIVSLLSHPTISFELETAALSTIRHHKMNTENDSIHDSH